METKVIAELIRHQPGSGDAVLQRAVLAKEGEKHEEKEEHWNKDRRGARQRGDRGRQGPSHQERRPRDEATPAGPETGGTRSVSTHHHRPAHLEDQSTTDDERHQERGNRGIDDPGPAEDQEGSEGR